MNNTVLGGLYTVDPDTGASEQIDLPDGAIAPGVTDGLLLRDRTLWVVENAANRLVKLRLSGDLSRGVVADVIDNDTSAGCSGFPRRWHGTARTWRWSTHGSTSACRRRSGKGRPRAPTTTWSSGSR